MSGKQYTNDKWSSSTDEEDTYDTKYNMRSRESLRDTRRSNETENEISTEPRKRGRGPSKRPCLSRNALMARENRQRKKAYLEKIEKKLAYYQQENENLMNLIKKKEIHLKQLTSECAYLKSVLNNNTSITALLKTINNGLQKINAQRKNSSLLNHASDSPDKLTKCANNVNTKENVLNGHNTEIFENNDSLLDHNTTESQSSESHVDSKRHFTFDIKNEVNSMRSTAGSTSEDSYMDNTELDTLLPIAEADLPNEEKKDTDVMMDFDQFSTFNIDIFDDLPKCDEMINAMDGLNDASTLFTEEEMTQTLDNTGICLHVNSDKVSLEFCSICHLNSKNLGLN